MWKQIYYELRKLLSQPFLAVLLLFTILIHGVLCYAVLCLPNDDGYSCVQEKEAWNLLTADTTAEQLEEARTLQAGLAEVSFSELSQQEFASWYAQYRIMEGMIEELQQDLDYPDFLAGVAAQAKLLQSSGLFSAASDYINRETAQIAADYQSLRAEPLPPGASTGVEAFTQLSITDLIMILWEIVLVLSLFVSEKQDGQFPLLKTTVQGEKSACLAKWSAAALSFLFLFLLCYGSRLLVIQQTIGLGQLDRPIQSVAAYYKCALPLSVGEFLLLFLFAKLGALWAFFSLIAGAASALSTVVGTVLTAAAAAGAESALYSLIDRYAWNGLWKELNLFAMVDTKHYFTECIYIDLNGVPVSAGAAACFTGAIVSLLGMALSALFWKRTSGTARSLSGRKRFRSGRRVHPSLAWQEVRKLLVWDHGLLLFLLLCGALAVCDQGTVPGGELEHYYQGYSQVLSGLLSDEKRAFLTQESQRIQEAASQAERYQAQYDAGELSAEALAYYLDTLEISDAQQAALEQAAHQYETLERLQAAGVSVQYVYETGWSRLFGAEGQRMDLVNSLLLSIFFMLTVGISRCREFHTGMWSLARTTQNGRRSEGMQLLLCALLGGLAALTAFLVHIGLLGMPLPGWNSVEYSVQSITVLSRGLGCSVLGYLFLQSLCRMAGGALAAALIWVIASGFKHIETTLLLSGLLLLGPGVLCLLGQWNAGPLLSLMTGAVLL